MCWKVSSKKHTGGVLFAMYQRSKVVFFAEIFKKTMRTDDKNYKSKL